MPIKIEVVRGVAIAERGNGKNLELATYITSSEYASKVDASGAALNSEGLYRAYYKSASKSSLVYEKIVTSGVNANLKTNHDPYAVYTIKAWVQFDAPGDVVATSQPYGTAGYINDSGTVKWVDTNGGIWTQAQAIAKLAADGSGTDPVVSAKYSLARRDHTADPDGDTVASRAVFFTAGNTATLPTAPAEGSISVEAAAATTHTLTGIGDSENKLTIGTFGLFVDGEAEVGGATDNLNSIHGDFTVTVEKAA